jgi:ribonuclease BN (tRNA processing enzyme)
MKITFLGTCSGTEPMPGMHQCSLVFEINGKYYWFDAGEGCAYRAFTSGFDAARVRSIFISHPHSDHIGGLPHLLATIHKICKRYELKTVNDSIDIYTPDIKAFEAAKYIAIGARYNPNGCDPNFVAHRVDDGLVFEDENIRVTALHNDHLREGGVNGWHSYSYLIEAEGKRIVFSGDVRYPDELTPLIGEGCDLLIMETGHHKVIDVCEYAEKMNVKVLRFNHHGREIIGDRAAAEALVASRGWDIKICYDGMVEVL